MASRRLMKLGVLIEGTGRTQGDWRHPLAQPDAMIDIKTFVKQAQECERAKHDFYFYSDAVSTSWKSMPYMMNRLEPISAMSAVAMVTSHIGLVVTMSSTYSEPYNLARGLASLDHVSNGRAGWNIVTSWNPEASANFGYDEIPKHKTRYEMADEHLDVCQKLWDSWEEEALVFDKAAGIYVDRDKMHKFNHRGEHYKVAGPLNISRMPQGYPVIFQAGASEDGRDFAARRAEAIFVSYQGLEQGRTVCKDIKTRTAQFGRDPNKLHILPGTTPYIAETVEKAQALLDYRNSLIPLELAIANAGKYFTGVDMTQFDPDAPFPDLFKPEHMEGSQYHMMGFLKKVKERKWTLRQAAQDFANPGTVAVGPPEKVADQMQLWFETGACDGFVLGISGPGQLELFNNEVLPILRKRGVAREEYEGTTLRDNLGLDVPPNQFSLARSVSA